MAIGIVNNMNALGFGGAGITPFLVKLGTQGDPVTKATTLSANITWWVMHTVPTDGTLTEVKIYANTGGSCKLKIFRYNSVGLFDIETISLTLSTGLNTFTYNKSFPKNSALGFYIPASGGAVIPYEVLDVGAGTGSISGELSGNGTSMSSSFLYSNNIQMQFTVQLSSYNSYDTELTFNQAKLLGWCINNTPAPWTLGAGYLTSTGTGLASFFGHYQTFNEDNIRSADFEFTGANDIFSVQARPVLLGQNVDSGTILAADIANNRLILYGTWSGGTNNTLPSVVQNYAITNLTLTIGVRYRLHLELRNRSLYMIITDLSNNATQTFTHNSTVNYPAGLVYGRGEFAALAGVINVYSFRSVGTKKNFKSMIVGDSIVEWYNGFAKQACDISGRATYSGDGGTLTNNAYRRIRHIMRYSHPRYMVTFIGVNSTGSDTGVLYFEQDIVILYNECLNLNTIPIICCLTPTSDAAKNVRIQTMNQFLLAQGWKLVRFDIALSLNNDGVTFNPAVMEDAVHPNTAGHTLLLQRLQLDAPEIF